MIPKWLTGLCILGIFGYSQGNTQPCDMQEKCLKVFQGEPRTWPKCYCTSLCQDSLSDLLFNCSSGQALWDNCGICLRCAKARGERCGGPHNVEGTCASGLACLTQVAPDLEPRERLEAEQAAFGTCVSETSEDCPKTADPQAARERKQGVNCRPGRVGLLLDALYCPDLGACHSPTPASFPLTSSTTIATTSVTSTGPSFATHDSERTRPQRKRPNRKPSVSFITLFLTGADD